MGKEKEEVKLLREINNTLLQIKENVGVKTSAETPLAQGATPNQEPSTALPNALAPAVGNTPQNPPQQFTPNNNLPSAPVAQQVQNPQTTIQAQPKVPTQNLQASITPEIVKLIGNLWVDSMVRTGTIVPNADTSNLRATIVEHMASNNFVTDQTVTQYLVSNPPQGQAYTVDNLNHGQVEALMKHYHVSLSGVVYNGFQAICNPTAFQAQQPQQ